MIAEKAAQLGRLWRTVRWLRPIQVLGRVRFRLQRPRPDPRPAPSRREITGPWATPAAREPSLIPPTRLRFLGEEHDLDRVGWDDPRLTLLWRYNQHYFDDLVALDTPSRRADQRALLARWLAENPPGRGTAYAPYPVSLRIVNWVKWFVGGVEPEPAWIDSLALQTRWLTRRLEWHLLGNHLFVNAKALVFAGLFFEGPEADTWLAAGLRILARQLPEQILPDGGQFERSPMYHALALEDLLDLLNVIAALAPVCSPARALEPGLRERCTTMLHWLRCMMHPGGALARFNDCAEGIAPACAELERYAAALGIDSPHPPPGDAVVALQPSGYLRVQRGPAVALLDAAPVGPDYLPGHAHADTLSFELSIDGRELIVNRGTSVYGYGPRRAIERGTAAHSTVQIGDENSSEVWSGFRVGRRARPGPVAVEGWTMTASHDGYEHLPGRPRHERRWHFDSRSLRIEDRLTPRAAEPAIARFHLAPGLALEPPPPGLSAPWRVFDGATVLATVEVEVGEAAIEHWQHARRFGELVDALTLCVRLQGDRAAVRWSWES
jgi:uncharacterized heparinase superfamily protein